MTEFFIYHLGSSLQNSNAVTSHAISVARYLSPMPYTGGFRRPSWQKAAFVESALLLIEKRKYESKSN